MASRFHFDKRTCNSLKNITAAGIKLPSNLRGGDQEVVKVRYLKKPKILTMLDVNA